MNTRTKKKLILAISLVIIFVVFVINIHKIKFAISMFTLYKQEKTSDTNINNEENEPKIVENPLQSILDTKTNPDNKDEEDNAQTENEDNTNKINNNKNNTNKPSKSTSLPYKIILTEYNAKLDNLRNEFEEELDNLVFQGIEEYKKGELSTSKLAAKYLSVGSKLEKDSDKKFDILLKEMEKALKNNGHETFVINDIKAFYESIKESKKLDLINKGLKLVK